jgi:leader peptidase (prepilin peptidase) / N-methyltransferase
VFENSASLFSALGLGYLLLTAWPLAKTDIRERRLPNRYVLPAFPITLLGQVLAGLASSNWWPMLWAIGSASATFVFALWVNRLGMLGMGDVKLMAAMSLALGWYSVLLPALALLVTFLIAGAWALALVVLKKTTLAASLPLGPYLIAGFSSALSVAVWS